MRRIIDPDTATSLMFAFSHGTSAPEVLPGIEDPQVMAAAAVEGGADCIFVAPGLIEATGTTLSSNRSLGVVVKVTATASRGGLRYQEALTVSVERALELGADGVVALIPFAPENEPDVIRLTASLGEACARWGMPYIAEAEFPNAYYGEEDFATSWGLPYLKRSGRICAELGADIVKTNWPGSPEAFAEIVACVPVPVVVAGGSRISDLDLLIRVQEAQAAGAIGCSVGRNVFQHAAPAQMLRAIGAVLREGLTPQQALDRDISGVAA